MVKELADRGKTDMIDGAFCDKISVSLTWPMCWDSARKQLSTLSCLLHEQQEQSIRVKKLVIFWTRIFIYVLIMVSQFLNNLGICKILENMYKVQILWKGHKIWKISHIFLKLLSDVKTKWEIFSNVCGLLRNSVFYLKYFLKWE